MSTSKSTEHLTDKWNIYFHDVKNPKWDDKSYVPVGGFNTIEQCWSIINALGDDVFTSCMIFIMRNGIPPKWEHYKNNHGGSYTMRISAKNAVTTFKSCLASILSESLVPEPDYIHGMSISPKTSHVIIKIWNENKMRQDPSKMVLKFPMEYCTDGIRYVPHVDRRV